LDLLALLTAPLAFTFFDWEDDEGRPSANALALLEAVRRHADRIAVFCQAGQIAVPKRIKPLYIYLEDSVFEVRAPSEGAVFHPKVWLIRYAAPDLPTAYRLLCASRNLTFDRSWDTLLALDGQVVERKKAFAANHPLGDFVSQLPELAVRTVPPALRRKVNQIQKEIRRVRFDLPQDFHGMRFWPLGIEGHRRWPFQKRMDRLLVVSPFIAENALGRLSDAGDGHVLVSRVEELSQVEPACLENFEHVFAMSPDAIGEDADEEESADPLVASEEGLVPRGLHAKLYVADAGWDARIWMGSANATNAAFGGNVEFLVELIGKKSKVGIDALLNQADKRTTFASLLLPFEPPEVPTAADPDQKAADDLVDAARRSLVSMGLTAAVSNGGDGELFAVAISRSRKRIDPSLREVSITCWPITVRADTGDVAVDVHADPMAVFPTLSMPGLTSFFAFQITGRSGARTAVRRFVLNIPLSGAPDDRQTRVLQSLLKDRDQVLQFLLLLLSAEGPDDAVGLLPSVGTGYGALSGRILGFDSTLMEALVRALHRGPEQIDAVADLVTDLRKTPETAALLPEGFAAVWEPVWAVREQLRR
jgi:hypothetical protein